MDIDSSSPLPLQALANCTLYDNDVGLMSISEKLDNLLFNEVFKYDDVKDNDILNAIWNTPDSDGVAGGNFRVYDIAAKLNDVRIVDAFASSVYDDTKPTKIIGGKEYRYIKDAWWMLLTTTAEKEDLADNKHYLLGEGNNYTLDSINNLVVNLSDHLKNDTIQDLMDYGYITIDSGTLAVITSHHISLDQNMTSFIADLVAHMAP